MEDQYWIDRAFGNLVLLYYWIMVFYYAIDPVSAYDINEKDSKYLTAHTYEAQYLTTHPDDAKIVAIRDDELQNAQELHVAMEKIKKLRPSEPKPTESPEQLLARFDKT